MSLKLVKGSNEYKTQIIDMLEEWIDYNSKNKTNRSPWAIFKNSYDDFDYYLNHLETSEPKDGLVPDSTFFCLDEERNIMVGAVNIRHYLNEHLLAHGGHIGDGIRPSERRKGYATQMIKLALEECKKLGIQKVLMVCDKENIGSAKSIIKNGGVLENELLENGKIEQRYWIELQNRFVSKYLIEKGWSGDKKYCVTNEKGNKFLLRVSSIEQYKRKKSEYELMQQVAALGVPMCKPLEFGVSDEGVFSIQSWIYGVDAEENAQNLTSEEQYFYGFEAGRILKEIHRVPAPEGIEDWEIYFNRKADRKIKMYEECPVKYENGQAFIDYINDHRHLLSGRPQTYQHGDYHIGNMMIGNDKRLYIIDFDRNDFGDPWEEFNRIVWCAQSTPLFATGMVNGYFDDDVPMEFWELLALYISSNTLSSVPWAIPFGDEQVQVMVNQAKDVLSWYDNMKNPFQAGIKELSKKMHFVTAKGILSSQNGMNIYRGCTHGCIYCDSRSKCYNFTHDFEDIEVKQNAPELLEQALRAKRKKCMIGTGSMCDPYMHCEESLKLTRACLEIIDKYEFGVAIQTKSNRILRSGRAK